MYAVVRSKGHRFTRELFPGEWDKPDVVHDWLAAGGKDAWKAWTFFAPALIEYFHDGAGEMYVYVDPALVS